MALKAKSFNTATGSISGAVNFKGEYNITTNSPVLTASLLGDLYLITPDNGTLAGISLNVGDYILFTQNASNPITSAMFSKIDSTDQIISVNGDTGPAVTLDTDDISEGSSNLYYTNARFDTQLATKDTDNVSEGSSNLYFTNARADTRADTRISASALNALSDVTYTAGAGIDNYVLTYDHANTTWKAEAAAGGISSVNGDTGPAVTLDTDDISEGSSNLYYTNARFDTQLATKDTDNVSEGSSNLYFTNARADTRADTRISASALNALSDVTYTAGAGIDNYVLTYDHANTTWKAEAAAGGISSVNGDTGPAVTLDTDDISEGSSNLYYTNARFDTQLATKDTDNVSEGSSNLYFTNARADTRADTRISASALSALSDVTYTAGAGIDNYVLTYDHANTTWKAEASAGGISSVNGDTGPAVTLDTDDISEGSSNLYYTNARFDTQLATKDTDNVSEGSSNLYFTNARADTRADTRISASALSALSDVTYTAGAGIDNYVLTYDHANTTWKAEASAGGISSVNGDTGPAVTLDTDDISEGSSNLYYTNARFDTQLATKDTDNVSEGSSNLYFTNARADTRADTRISASALSALSDVTYTAGAGIDNYVLTYDHANTTWKAEAAAGGALTYAAKTTSSDSPLTPAADYHYSINADSATFVVNLPALSSLNDGQRIRFKFQARGNAAYDVTINRAGSDTIDGATTQTLSVTYSSITLVVGSTEWEII